MNCYGHNLRSLNLFCKRNAANNTGMNTATSLQRREESARTAPRRTQLRAAGAIHPFDFHGESGEEGIRLADGGLWSRVPAPTGLRITCVSGDLWITQAGGANDTIVRRGTSFVTTTRGKVVVQAMRDATFRYEDQG